MQGKGSNEYVQLDCKYDSTSTYRGFAESYLPEWKSFGIAVGGRESNSSQLKNVGKVAKVFN